MARIGLGFWICGSDQSKAEWTVGIQFHRINGQDQGTTKSTAEIDGLGTTGMPCGTHVAATRWRRGRDGADVAANEIGHTGEESGHAGQAGQTACGLMVAGGYHPARWRARGAVGRRVGWQGPHRAGGGVSEHEKREGSSAARWFGGGGARDVGEEWPSVSSGGKEMAAGDLLDAVKLAGATA
ncbi:hypothetical protein E2562_010224 [Oryza meyeriana var. granulata]|uniref:DUF834 domain-containing protein n=1 Tax=Oryza meyeriana var. granulata TaxID=110450 RepID=A0A6G1EIG3_9ORYZ|nr:hypothetical protein E2562_010224 [Oryza meyeriana var. granulata]